MRFSNMTSIVSAFAVIALAGVAAPAFAQPEEVQMSVKVRVAGLDLNSSQGATIALNRISHAASNVCGGAPTFGELDRQAAFSSCRKAAIAGAVLTLNQPALNQLAAVTPARPMMVAAR